MEKEGFKFAKIHPFSERQAEIIKAIFNGYTSYKEIAEHLEISYHTVKSHLVGTDTTSSLTGGKATKNALGIYGIVERITGDKPSITKLISVLLGDVVFPTGYNMYEKAPPFLTLKDPDLKRGIDIIFQDFRPSIDLPEFSNILQTLKDPVDCLEIDFIDRKKDFNPFRSVFFNVEDLRNSLEDARLAVEVSRLSDQPLNSSSGRLVRYEYQDAVRLGIISGYDEI